MPPRVADLLPAAAVAAVALVVSAAWPGQRPLDGLGIALALAAVLPLAWRRRWPVPVLVAQVATSAPYHVLEYSHDALMPAAALAIYTVASTGERLRSLLISGGTCVLALTIQVIDNGALRWDSAGTFGWLVSAVLLGDLVRSRRAFVAAAVERAQRDERLRIARDLHDLLAHSITQVQVQAGVAAHLLAEQSAEFDRPTVVATLDSITAACAQARDELHTTLAVLRDGAADERQPVPSLARLADLAEPVTAAGVRVRFDTTGEPRELPRAVDVAVYRIVQESLTNVVKHADAAQATVAVHYGAGMLRLTVTDDGHGASGPGGGYGLVGMRERARSVGGSLATTSSADGFTVTAELPTGEPR